MFDRKLFRIALAIFGLQLLLFLFLNLLCLGNPFYWHSKDSTLALLGAAQVSYLIYAVEMTRRIFLRATHSLSSDHVIIGQERFTELIQLGPSHFVVAGLIGLLGMQAFGLYANQGADEWFFFHEEPKDIFVAYQRFATSLVGVLLLQCLYLNYRAGKLVANIPRVIEIEKSVSRYKFDPILNSNFQCTLLLLGFIFLFSTYMVILPNLQTVLMYFVIANSILWLLLIGLPTYLFEYQCSRVQKDTIEDLRNQMSEQYQRVLSLDVKDENYYHQAKNSLDRAEMLNTLSVELTQQRRWSNDRSTYFKAAIAIMAPFVTYLFKIITLGVIKPLSRIFFAAD